MMSPEQSDMLKEVHSALVGNEKMGHKGLVKRVEDLETYKEADSNLKLKIVGGVTVGSLFGSGLLTWIKSLL